MLALHFTFKHRFKPQEKALLNPDRLPRNKRRPRLHNAVPLKAAADTFDHFIIDDSRLRPKGDDFLNPARIEDPAEKPVAVVLLSVVIDAVCVPVTVLLTLGDLVMPETELAVLVTEPASRSACVIVYVPEHVMVAVAGATGAGDCGARPPAGCVQTTPEILLSVIVTADFSVVLPVLVTRYE